uniref:ST3 beta-galactoside alpha-2,3-sialyltransferase 2 n=1 Tax=Sinocyclocheilus grahami TaxID=75366 RepID=A0A672P6J6_SINGR
MPSVPPQREGRFSLGWGWGWAAWARAQRTGELRPWVAAGVGPAVAGERGGKRCSLRFCVVLGSLALLFLTSLFFSFSLRGGAGLPYLEPPGWEESHRVKLQKTCACSQCVGDPGISDWFDENYDPDISPVWIRDNIQLPSDVYYWWVMLQPQFKPHNIQQVLQRLFQVIPGRSPYGSWDPARCLRCAVVGNSGNLREAGYGPVIDGHDFIMRMNLAPTVGYEEDAGSRTTHHFMYPESAKNLAANVSFVLVPFKTLDLLWITSALSSGQIRLKRDSCTIFYFIILYYVLKGNMMLLKRTLFCVFGVMKCLCGLRKKKNTLFSTYCRCNFYKEYLFGFETLVFATLRILSIHQQLVTLQRERKT